MDILCEFRRILSPTTQHGYFKLKKEVLLQYIDVCVLEENTIIIKHIMFNGDI